MRAAEAKEGGEEGTAAQARRHGARRSGGLGASTEVPDSFYGGAWHLGQCQKKSRKNFRKNIESAVEGRFPLATN